VNLEVVSSEFLSKLYASATFFRNIEGRLFNSLAELFFEKRAWLNNFGKRVKNQRTYRNSFFIRFWEKFDKIPSYQFTYVERKRLWYKHLNHFLDFKYSLYKDTPSRKLNHYIGSDYYFLCNMSEIFGLTENMVNVFKVYSNLAINSLKGLAITKKEKKKV